MTIATTFPAYLKDEIERVRCRSCGADRGACFAPQQRPVVAAVAFEGQEARTEFCYERVHDYFEAHRFPALDALLPGQQIQEMLGDHAFIVTATSETGRDTGRRRYRVVCRTCRLVVHTGTTGPQYMMEGHVRRMTEDGHDAPFPGTSVGAEE